MSPLLFVAVQLVIAAATAMLELIDVLFIDIQKCLGVT